MAVNLDDTTVQTDDTILEIELTDDPKDDVTDVNTDPEKGDDTGDKGTGTAGAPVDDNFIEIELGGDHEEIAEESTQTTTTEDDDNQGGFNWKEIVRFAKDKEIFTDTTDEDLEALGDDIEGFSEVLQKELEVGIQHGIDERFATVNAKSEGLVQHLLDGGNIHDFIKVSADDYTSLTEASLTTDIAMQEKVVRADYKENTKWSDDKINKYITKLKDLDELHEESKSSLVAVKEKQIESKNTLARNTAQAKVNTKAELDRRVAYIKTTLDETKEFAGVKITPKMKTTINNNIAEDSTFNKINKDMDKYRVNLAILDSLGLLDGDGKHIQKVLGTKATRDIKKEIDDYDFTRGSKGKTRKTATDKGALTSAMSQVDKQFNTFNI